MSAHKQPLGKLPIGIVMVFLAHLVPYVLVLVVAGGDRRSLLRVDLLLTLYALLSLVGFAICLAVSRAVQGTISIVICMSICTVSLVQFTLASVADQGLSWFTAIAYLAPVLSTLFFIRFLRRVAVCLERDDLLGLADSIMFPATLGCVFGVTGIVPLVNVLTLPIAVLFLSVGYARFLWLMYRTLRAVRALETPTSAAASDTGMDAGGDGRGGRETSW